MLVMYTLLHHYYTLVQLSFLLVSACEYKTYYYTVITYFYTVRTCYYIDHYDLFLQIHYYLLLQYNYIIITSLLTHYAIFQIHVIMDSLVHFIALACFIITSLLPIVSLFPLLPINEGATCRCSVFIFLRPQLPPSLPPSLPPY